MGRFVFRWRILQPLQQLHYLQTIVFSSDCAERSLCPLSPRTVRPFQIPAHVCPAVCPIFLVARFLGYSIWTSLNLLLPAFAIYKLQGISGRTKVAMSTLLLLEGFTSALNSQSNGLMLGLLLFAFVAMQNGRISQAVLFIWLTAFIKLFGVLFFAMLLVFPVHLRSPCSEFR